jgi:hypothetical protein
MVRTARRVLRQRLLVPSEVKPGTFDADAITWQIDNRPTRGVDVGDTQDVYLATIDSSRRAELLAGESIRKATNWVHKHTQAIVGGIVTEYWCSFGPEDRSGEANPEKVTGFPLPLNLPLAACKGCCFYPNSKANKHNFR